MKHNLAIIAQPEDIVTSKSSGSISIIIYEIAKRLTDIYNVTIFSRSETNLSSNEIDNGLSFIRINTNWDDSIIYYSGRAKIKAATIIKKLKLRINGKDYFSSYFYFFYILKISFLLRKNRYNHVLIPNFSQFVPIVKLINPGIKIIFNIQCEWLTQIKYSTAKFRIKKMDAITGCSRFIINGISERFPNHKKKCNVLYNGVDIEHFNSEIPKNKFKIQYSNKGEKIICYVGRITPEKGIHTLVDAMKIVVNKRPDVVLLVAGAFSYNPPNPQNFDNDDFERIKSNYKEYLIRSAQQLDKNIKFLGLVSRSELPDFYRACDIFIHPAIWNEPLGITLLEAMACGKPVISTPRGGIPEILIDGENGKLVEHDDPVLLAETILSLLNSTEILDVMGKKGRTMVESKFTWDHIAKDIKQIIKQL